MKFPQNTYPIIILMVISMLLLGSPAMALPWPIQPDSSSHVVSFFYGGWQGMWRADLGENVNYFHVGMDIPGGTAEPVYAVESGYVKAVFTIFDSDYAWRIVIADSSGTEQCEGWLYAHLIPGSIPLMEGEYVDSGDYLGALITWPYPNTPIHLHFSRVRFAGDATAWATGFWDYEFTANPLNYIGSPGDTITPFMENAWTDQLFAICGNETSLYFDTGEDISGDVDIICSAYDNCGYIGYKTCPYKLEYRIEGDSSIPWTTSFEFDGSLDSYDGEMEALSYTVFKYDSYCMTGWTEDLIQYYILTNTDGDGIIEVDDAANCWSTTFFHNGDYKIFARATDFDGNSYVDSMTVSVRNTFLLSGTVGLEGIDPGVNGIITIVPDNLTTFSSAEGEYSFPEVGGGYQTVSISRPGYVTFDTLLLFNQDHQVDATLSLIDYVCGDANFDGQVNVADAVYIISYVFKGGPDPIPLEAGDANCDGGTNVGDAVYLISYVFKGGPEPCCP
jgi:hypothetical protein